MGKQLSQGANRTVENAFDVASLCRPSTSIWYSRSKSKDQFGWMHEGEDLDPNRIWQAWCQGSEPSRQKVHQHNMEGFHPSQTRQDIGEHLDFTGWSALRDFAISVIMVADGNAAFTIISSPTSTNRRRYMLLRNQSNKIGNNVSSPNHKSCREVTMEILHDKTILPERRFQNVPM